MLQRYLYIALLVSTVFLQGCIFAVAGAAGGLVVGAAAGSAITYAVMKKDSPKSKAAANSVKTPQTNKSYSVDNQN